MDEFDVTNDGKKRNDLRVITDPGKQFSVELYKQVMQLLTRDGSPLEESIEREGLRMWEEFQPRDAVERMLVGQMIWTHAQVAHLSRFAPQQKHPVWFKQMHAARGGAVASFVQLVQALADHRHPRRRNFMAIRQANIASRQIINERCNNEDKMS